ncbi:MAG: hypothetical protein ACRDKD_07335 [Solirubrobacteraceae bacterium]
MVEPMFFRAKPSTTVPVAPFDPKYLGVSSDAEQAVPTAPGVVEVLVATVSVWGPASVVLVDGLLADRVTVWVFVTVTVGGV